MNIFNKLGVAIIVWFYLIMLFYYNFPKEKRKANVTQIAIFSFMITLAGFLLMI